jgi:hypothetical protein
VPLLISYLLMIDFMLILFISIWYLYISHRFLNQLWIKEPQIAKEIGIGSNIFIKFPKNLKIFARNNKLLDPQLELLGRIKGVRNAL